MQFSRYIVCLRSPSGLFREDPKKRPGSHLLSHAVPSIVPSAAQGLTIVFGMGTGVSPERIATGNILFLMCITLKTEYYVKPLLLLP